jgi:murein DD-endopeptidase MepM/ murein hydrolase activator NlpD
MSHWRVLTFLICLLLVSQPLAAQDVFEQQKKLDEIEKKIEDNNKKILPKKVKKKKAEKNLGVISRRLRYTEIKLESTQKKLKKAKTSEQKTKAQLDKLQKQYEIREKAFTDRLIEIYKMKNLGFIEFLFSGSDMVSHTDSAYYFDRIINKDIEMIETIQKEHQHLKEKRRRLEKQTQRIDSLKKEIAKREKTLKTQQRKQTKLVNSLERQIDAIEKQNKELERSSNEITKLIRKKGGGRKGYHAVGKFIKPVHGWLSSKYGYRKHPIFKRRIKHNGIDLAAPRGYKIKAANSGYVIVAGQKPRYKGYGKIVVIDHGRRPSDKRTVSSFYAHQSRILVKEGQFVKKGQEIGWVGSTGFATGPHLHFEIRIDGVPVNPLKYLDI